MSVMRVSLDDGQFKGNSFKKRKSTPTITRQPLVTNAGPRILPTQTVKKKKKFSYGKLIIVCAVIALGWKFAPNIWSSVKTASSVVSEIVPIIPALEPELKKDENGKTNILIVGIDTRESGPLELSTDTIILASYDDETHRLSMLSFPRDISTTYPNTSYLGRINGLYAYGEKQQKGSGLDMLVSQVESISNQEIQYYGMVDLKGFVDAINTIGGVDIYLETKISGAYPLESLYYKNISFPQGWNHMDGNQALQYSRLRKNVIPVSEGSDFARARRQQKVIGAIIDQATKSDTLLDTKKIFELLEIASDNVKTSKFSIEDMQAGISILKDSGKPEMFSYVLDFYAGGDLGRLIQVITVNPYHLGPRLGADKWSEIQALVKEYFAEPMLLTMEKSIKIYNANESDFASKYQALTTRFYYAPIEKGGQAPVELSGKVYAIGGARYEPLATFFADLLNIEVGTDKPEMFETGDWGDVGVVVIL